MDSNYLSAVQAAKALNVSLQTLYAYVSRKGVRSLPIAGTRRRRYWKSDIDRLRDKKLPTPITPGPLKHESEITLLTGSDVFYRGRNAVELAEHSSFESVAALLWGFKEEEVFGKVLPKIPPLFKQMDKLLAKESEINRATALFTLLEQANPKAYDLSAIGMARTGVDILRCLAAITLRTATVTTEPLHSFIARSRGLSPPLGDLVRRLLILSADHAFEPGAVAVRTVASAGVTPWRSLISGFSVTLGRRGRMGSFEAIHRFVVEIVGCSDPYAMVVGRIREGEPLPGFDSYTTAAVHPNGDPRARAIFQFCGTILARDPAFARLKEVAAAIKEIRNAEPSFAFMCVFVGWKIGLHPQDSLFHLGRAAGWVAHAIEQYQAGETDRQPETYQGELPA
ncbi:MAG TPA: citrate synthase [Steroidobacteraceae bacterium]|nr:citrate synthase [Steroidobacteraceae bacterium]